MNAGNVISAICDSLGDGWITFPEVKNGPSWSGVGQRRMDLLAIKKTWRPVTIAAYEVKVSRADFIRDKKWPEYLPLCNTFYWACPKGLISRKEIDPRCGLVWMNPGTGRAHVVRRALWRDTPPDPMMLLYLLFWRREQASGREATMARIRTELETREETGREYGIHVATALRRAAVREGDAAKVEERNAKYKVVSDWISAHAPGAGAERIVEMLETADMLRAYRLNPQIFRDAAARFQEIAGHIEHLRRTADGCESVDSGGS